MRSDSVTQGKKRKTDVHWNERAAAVENDIEVNIKDIFQRDLEFDHILRRLTREMTVLEVGCGNGFSTNLFRERVKHIDAFDCSENMIKRARAAYGETNNRFIIDNILNPQRLDGQYDAVICIRVLINLQSVVEQHLAIQNLAQFVKFKGILILAEGFREGFEALTDLRLKIGLPAIEPAKINFYSSLKDLLPLIEQYFAIENTFHLGAYDYLTRVLYPLLVGNENVKHNTIFSERSALLAKEYNPDCFENLSRMRGYILRKQV
jgi:SAM-dependent methyltransferase